MTYQEVFENTGTLDQVNEWLAENPPPEDWRSDPLAWAYVEMPFSRHQRVELREEFRELSHPKSKLFKKDTNDAR